MSPERLAAKKPDSFGAQLLFLTLLAAALLFSFSALPPRREAPVRAVFGGKAYELELAVTQLERERGLSGRDSLCPDCAMLFVFDHPNRYGFWMKEMRFPLDLVFVSGSRVVSVERSVPADSSATFFPPSAVDRVIEGNQGFAEALQPGDTVGWRY